MSAPDGLVDVHLLQVPVGLWARSREHSEALQRELALVAQDQEGLPARLVQLVTSARAQYAAESSAQEEALEDAVAAGLPVLDLLYRVPPVVAGLCEEIGRTFDEADAYCREGEHLLTLAADEEIRRFRHWFLGQFSRQVSGLPPVPWPDAAD